MAYPRITWRLLPSWNMKRISSKFSIDFDFFSKVESGKAYIAFTEYSKDTFIGTVVFKDASIIEALKDSKEKTKHLFLYDMFHGGIPRPGDGLIATGKPT